MNDKNTNIQSLKDILKKFNNERDWSQFHDIKNLAEAISIEAGELQELFLWQKPEDLVIKIKKDKEFKKEVGEELADVIAFCLNFANSADLDVSKIVKDKVKKNAKKYPVRKAKGTATKYNKL